MFAELHSDINSYKSGLLQRHCKRLDQQKSKMELETKDLGTILLICI